MNNHNLVITPFQRSGNMDDYNPALDQTLQEVIDIFESDATSAFVPTGIAILRFSELLEALDWNLYATKTITLEDAREKIRKAANLMDKKFDIEYKRLPR